MKRKIYCAGSRLKDPCPICDMKIEKGNFWVRYKGQKLHMDAILKKKEEQKRIAKERMEMLEEQGEVGICVYCGREIRRLEELACMEAGKGLVCNREECKGESYK